jgi:transposase-like protein
MSRTYEDTSIIKGITGKTIFRKQNVVCPYCKSPFYIPAWAYFDYLFKAGNNVSGCARPTCPVCYEQFYLYYDPHLQFHSITIEDWKDVRALLRVKHNKGEL